MPELVDISRRFGDRLAVAQSNSRQATIPGLIGAGGIGLRFVAGFMRLAVRAGIKIYRQQVSPRRSIEG